jgi:hypothetical protein
MTQTTAYCVLIDFGVRGLFEWRARERGMGPLLQARAEQRERGGERKERRRRVVVLALCRVRVAKQTLAFRRRAARLRS